MADSIPSEGQPARSIVRAAGEGRVISFGEAGEAVLKLVSDESAGTMSAYEFVVPAATAGSPLHLHRTWDEAFYVLAGEMTFLIDAHTSTASAGSFVFIPRGDVTCLGQGTCTSGSPSSLVCIGHL